MHPSFLKGRAGPGTDGSFASVAMRPPGSPWFRHAGESALHERDHRGGDHPIPFRTRQLSPPSPKVLQRQAAGGQGVALMQGASAYTGPSGPFYFSGLRGPFPISGQGSPRPAGCSRRLAGRVPRRPRCLLEAPSLLALDRLPWNLLNAASI